MTTKRKFCRFNSSLLGLSGLPAPEGLVTTDIPAGGMCLSSFLVILNRPNSVLMGLLNPDAPWDEIGGLDESRVRAHSTRWMLPSCHLMVHESPLEAAQRIAKEQLELDDVALSEPKIVSEVYRSPSFPERPMHWDIEFIFKSNLKGTLPKSRAWVKLDYVDLSKTPRSEIARSHEDVLENAGLKFTL